MKKLLVSLTTVVLALFCSVSVFAFDTDDSGMWNFEEYAEGVELVNYNGTQTDVYIPNKITKGDTEYAVVKLGE